MRTMWSGAVNFGLVNIPVKLYSGSQSHRLDLDMLHNKDMSPIRFARVCREDGKEVPWDEIVKGYEYRKGDYVILEKEDFEKADPGRQDTIDIKAFADVSEVDPVYFEKPYYLAPDRGGAKTYALLREALKKSGRVAIAKYVFRNREHLGCIRPSGNLLMMVQMRFADEVRSTEELKLPEDVEVSKDEMKLANQLIDQLTRPFEPEQYHDTYQEELERIIEQKVEGEKPKAAKPKQKAEVKDLMSALKKSLDQEKKQKQGKAKSDQPARKSA